MSLHDLTLRTLFASRDGLHQFAGVRVFLLDAEAIAASRRTLIDTLGVVATKRQFLAFGHSQGWRTASSLMRVVNQLTPRRHLNHIVHRLLVLIGTTRTGPQDVDESTITLYNSCEAEVLKYSEPTADTVCWFPVGFTAGYLSRALGHIALCREEQCVGRGDPICRMHVELLPHLTLDLAGTESEALACAHLQRHLGVDAAVIPTTLGSGTRAERIALGMRSPRMRTLIIQAHRAAAVEATVLITGESGVGKSETARYIHDHSRRAAAPFLIVSCGALPETLLENELFGHRRGAFTGAIEDRAGLLEAAAGGTILLDEIAELTPSMQVKLLDVLQSREVRRLGETRSRPIDVRVMAATNRDLSAEVRAKRFRQDLYYRLDVLPFEVPPLRERLEDLRTLADALLTDAARRMNRPVLGYTASALEAMMTYHWPGNIRELENVVERMCALTSGTVLDLDDLPPQIRHRAMVPARRQDSIRPLRDVEREHILKVLDQLGGNRTRAAEALGIAQDTLYRRLREYRPAEESLSD